VAASLIITAAASLPYWLAYSVPAEHAFAGILINPADGNSYFAKMREGWAGNWLFTLPYTAEPGPGVFIFTWYLFLGHLARWTGASLDLVYALARAASGLAVLLTAYSFLGTFFPQSRARVAAWLLFALGSGLGWTAVPFGAFTSDLWVAEAFPFLAIFSNAHFGLATALLLWILRWALPGLVDSPPAPRQLVGLALVTSALAQVQPMALLNAGLIIAGVVAWHAVTARSWRPLVAAPVIVFGLCAVPWLVYDFLLTVGHAVLTAWNAQNLTPSPPFWDALLSGGVPLLLALGGLVVAARRRAPTDIILIVWLVLNGLALYAPFALQRRLSLGLWLPVSALAIIGLQDLVWPRLKPAWRSLLIGGLAVAVLPSNLLLYAATLNAVARRDPAIFWTADEAAGLRWLSANAVAGSLVLAAPDTGLFVPARTDARVIYGHPFETTFASDKRQAVEAFFAGQTSAATFLSQHGVDFVFFGPRERALAPGGPPGAWPVVFASGEVEIYAP
jgi:hypothetical protein